MNVPGGNEALNLEKDAWKMAKRWQLVKDVGPAVVKGLKTTGSLVHTLVPVAQVAAVAAREKASLLWQTAKRIVKKQ